MTCELKKKNTPHYNAMMINLEKQEHLKNSFLLIFDSWKQALIASLIIPESFWLISRTNFSQHPGHRYKTRLNWKFEHKFGIIWKKALQTPSVEDLSFHLYLWAMVIVKFISPLPQIKEYSMIKQEILHCF